MTQNLVRLMGTVEEMIPTNRELEIEETMANLTKRINIVGMCRTKKLWTGTVSAGDELEGESGGLDGVKPSTWEPQGSNTTERSVLVDEGSAWRNIPLNVFNILQAAETEPVEVAAVMIEEVPELDDKFDLLDLEPGEPKFYKEMAQILVYLSVERSEDYAARYWYNPWQRAKKMNPELLGEGRQVIHPGKDGDSDDEPDVNDDVQSASEVSW